MTTASSRVTGLISFSSVPVTLLPGSSNLAEDLSNLVIEMTSFQDDSF